ncbi:UNVERIFIED_CONTAM: hypothetical protein Sradi_0678300 [Sesamum radiatum]|uniref:Uncharacterized protein n=1 Tax=Sesamum radiatum TaxID=300843 RepID=A0AAW2VMK8_SESRA
MNANDQEGTSNPRRYREKSDKTCTRRTWTQREEKALVNALRTICCTGWRCENGFRAGYLNQLEALLLKQFPGSDIRAEPTSIARSMFGRSTTAHFKMPLHGQCASNHGRFFRRGVKLSGEIEREGARIFETVHEYNPLSKSNMGQFDSQECYVPTAEWCPDTGYVATRKSTSSSKRRKVVRETEDDGFSNAVSTFCQSANERLAEMTKKLFCDYIEGEKRAAVFEAVGEVPGMDMNNQILISNRLVDNPKKMDLFFSLPAEARVRMVMMLNGKM